MSEPLTPGTSWPMPWQTPEEYCAAQQKMLQDERAQLIQQLKAKFSLPEGYDELFADVWYDGKYD